MIPAVYGLPGLRTAVTATHRIIFKGGRWDYVSLPGGATIDASESRDPANTGFLGNLRAGLLMGKITATGLYAPSILGAISGAYTSGGTSLTVSAAVATEIDRICGQAGTAELVAIGPPTANGTNAVTDITHSAINTTTGVITVSDLGVDKVAGTLIARKDGRQLPITLIPDGYPIKVTDSEGTSVDVGFPKLPIGGTIISENILPVWPSDTSIMAWIVEQLNAAGQFVFDHKYKL
jgi:hypothetical protein